MSVSPPAAASPANRLRLRTLAGCAALLCVAVVAFNLLYLYLPKDKWTPHGYAPDIGAAYARTVPLPDVAIGPRAFTRISLGLQAAMWGAFLAIVILLRNVGDRADERRAYRLVVVSGALASLLLLLTPPTLSTDLYRYAVFGRMIVTRGLNPYVTPGNALAGDPILALADGTGIPTYYGPLFTDLSVLAALVGGAGPIRTALAFKLMATASGALAAWAVVALARQQGRSGLLPLALVVLNPLVLLETPGNGHNEIVMMGLALAGLAIAGRGRPNLGFALLVCSVHIKWVTAPLVALVAIARLHDTAGLRARARQLAGMLLIAAGVSALLYLPFWTEQIGRATGTLLIKEAHNRGLRSWQLLPLGAIVLGGIAVVARSGRRHLLEMAALACFACVLFIVPWWMPWYLIPPLTLLAVGPFGRLNAWLFVTVMVFLLLLSPIWTHLLPR
jgi:hypothetical protein